MLDKTGVSFGGANIHLMRLAAMMAELRKGKRRRRRYSSHRPAWLKKLQRERRTECVRAVKWLRQHGLLVTIPAIKKKTGWDYSKVEQTLKSSHGLAEELKVVRHPDKKRAYTPA